jgi:hypothetical protein
MLLRPHGHQGAASVVFRMNKTKGDRRESHAEHMRQPKIAYMILSWDKWKDEMSKNT